MDQSWLHYATSTEIKIGNVNVNVNAIETETESEKTPHLTIITIYHRRNLCTQHHHHRHPLRLIIHIMHPFRHPFRHLSCRPHPIHPTFLRLLPVDGESQAVVRLNQVHRSTRLLRLSLPILIATEIETGTETETEEEKDGAIR